MHLEKSTPKIPAAASIIRVKKLEKKPGRKQGSEACKLLGMLFRAGGGDNEHDGKDKKAARMISSAGFQMSGIN